MDFFSRTIHKRINIGHISLSVTAQWHFSQPQCNKSGLTSIVSIPAKKKQAALLHKPFCQKQKCILQKQCEKHGMVFAYVKSEKISRVFPITVIGSRNGLKQQLGLTFN